MPTRPGRLLRRRNRPGPREATGTSCLPTPFSTLASKKVWRRGSGPSSLTIVRQRADNDQDETGRPPRRLSRPERPSPPRASRAPRSPRCGVFARRSSSPGSSSSWRTDRSPPTCSRPTGRSPRWLTQYIDDDPAPGSGSSRRRRADDATLVRRLTLDLAGRIPTAAESRAFVESTDPEKTVRLVDRLMASPGYVRHQVAELDAMLMAGERGSLRDYLVRAVGENGSWDRIFRELMLPDQTDKARKVRRRIPPGAGQGYRPAHRRGQLDVLRGQHQLRPVPRPSAGGRLEAGPLLRDEGVPRPHLPQWQRQRGFLGERGFGTVKFKTTEGVERQARMMFLTGRKVAEPEAGRDRHADEQKKEKEQLQRAQKDEGTRRRRRSSAPGPSLVEMATGSPATATSSRGRSSTASGTGSSAAGW